MAATEDQLVEAAQTVCDGDGRGIIVTGISVVPGGFGIVISLPKSRAMSDADWWGVINEVRDKLARIPDIIRIDLDLPT